jgi:hypothetical protein
MLYFTRGLQMACFHLMGLKLCPERVTVQSWILGCIEGMLAS